MVQTIYMVVTVLHICILHVYIVSAWHVLLVFDGLGIYDTYGMFYIGYASAILVTWIQALYL